jgi:hypothetical protein
VSTDHDSARRQREQPAARARHAKSRGQRDELGATMDNEQINAIGTLLADLSERTEQLRGYL